VHNFSVFVYFLAIVNRFFAYSSKTERHFSILLGTPIVLHFSCCEIANNNWRLAETFPLQSADISDSDLLKVHSASAANRTWSALVCLFNIDATIISRTK